MPKRKRKRTLANITTVNVVATNQHTRVPKDVIPDDLVQQHHSSDEQNIAGMQQPPATPTVSNDTDDTGDTGVTGGTCATAVTGLTNATNATDATGNTGVAGVTTETNVVSVNGETDLTRVSTAVVGPPPNVGAQQLRAGRSLARANQAHNQAQAWWA